MSKEKKSTLWGKIGRIMDGPSTALFTSGMTVELLGGKQATVEGIRTIVEYDDTLVRLTDYKHEVSVMGQKLSLLCMSERSVVVEGKIERIEYIDWRNRT